MFRRRCCKPAEHPCHEGIETFTAGNLFVGLADKVINLRLRFFMIVTGKVAGVQGAQIGRKFRFYPEHLADDFCSLFAARKVGGVNASDSLSFKAQCCLLRFLLAACRQTDIAPASILPPAPEPSEL